MSPDRACGGTELLICKEALPEEVAAVPGRAGLVGASWREARSAGMSLAAGRSPQHVSVLGGSSEAAGRWRGLWCWWHTGRAG